MAPRLRGGDAKFENESTLHLPPARQTQHDHRRSPDLNQSGAVILGCTKGGSGRSGPARQRAGRAN